jgi:hypothetical protein
LWTACDAAEEYHSPYTYVGNNPICAFDPNGLWTVKAGFGLGYAVTAKVGYNEGRLTLGIGGGEGNGGIVSFNPATTKSSANTGITAEIRVTAKVEIGFLKFFKFGGTIEASARADQAGNYVNKVKGDLFKTKINDNSAKLSYEIGEKGNTNTSAVEYFDKYSVSQESSFGAFQFIGAEAEISGSANDLKKK